LKGHLSDNGGTGLGRTRSKKKEDRTEGEGGKIDNGSTSRGGGKMQRRATKMALASVRIEGGENGGEKRLRGVRRSKTSLSESSD